jgi:hypothetical protein
MLTQVAVHIVISVVEVHAVTTPCSVLTDNIIPLGLILLHIEFEAFFLFII